MSVAPRSSRIRKQIEEGSVVVRINMGRKDSVNFRRVAKHDQRNN